MILLTKRSSVFGILLANLIYFLKLSSCDPSGDDNTGDSDEVVKLKQALLLVELLKTDYAKVLRDNAELRNGNGDMYTCAATTEKEGPRNAMTTSTKTYTVNLLSDNAALQNINGDTKSTINSTPSVGIPNMASDSSNAFARASGEPPQQTLWAGAASGPGATLPRWSPPPLYSLTHQPLAQMPHIRRNMRNPYGYFRRMIPNDYYYYDNIPQTAVRSPFRRFNYNDAFGEHPNDTASTTVRTSSLTTKQKLNQNRHSTKKHYKTTPSSQTVTASSSVINTDNTDMSRATAETTDITSTPKKSKRHKHTRKPHSKHSKTTASSRTIRTIRTRKNASSSELDHKIKYTGSASHISASPKKSKLKHTMKSNKIHSTADSTEAVKSSFVSNSKPRVIESSGIKLKTTPNFYEIGNTTPISSAIEKSITNDPVMSQVASELFDEFKEENVMKLNENLKTKGTRRSDSSHTYPVYKTTMKIHLEGSTRYPIPFPENHAFCFTNPYNPLCRTLI